MNFWRASLLMLTALVGCAGCSSPHQLNKVVATDALKRGLDAWQAGQTPETLRNGSPSVIFGDSDWENGVQLRQYRILNAERSDGTNLHADVELTLVTAKQKARKVTITYIVGTEPKITVFRQ